MSKNLRFELGGPHSARRGDYRIIHRIDDLVTSTAIEHRADIHRERFVAAQSALCRQRR